jgi:hypothetical protein
VFFRTMDLTDQETSAEWAKRPETNAQLAQHRNYLRRQIPFP